MIHLNQLGLQNLPQPPKFSKLLGPSFVLLGLGLGSGELILWPYLSAKYGLGLVWGMVIGITFQFFINMEIERYTLATGESVFVGLSRKFGSLSPLWFILSTFLPWMWPGIILSSAILLSSLINVNSTFITVTLLLLIGLLLSISKIVYKTQEQFQKYLIILGVPFIFALCLIFVKPIHLNDLFRGLAGQGNGFFLLPLTLPLFTFLGALAYSGAGGNLNLAQSFYIREKGYGMGKFMGRITSVITGKAEQWRLTGMTFAVNQANLGRFKRWWRVMNLEHGLIFWGAGLATILLIALLAYNTTSGLGKNSQGVNFVIAEAEMIGQRLAPGVGTVFLVIVGLFLFGTQLSVLDASSRILAENWLLLFPTLGEKRLRSLFYMFLWLQIGAGVVNLAIRIRDPLLLLTIGAVLNAVAMLVHSGLTLWLNTTSLPPALQPNWWRRGALVLAVGGFAILSGLSVVK